jgi:phosphosulfolactate synthase (CoM biosynthesis protein A)
VRRAPFLITTANEIETEATSMQFSIPAGQRAGRQTAQARLNGNPRPYYSVVGRRYLEDLFEMMAAYVDSLKFAGGSFTLMPERAVREIIDLCHKHDVFVSTGGFIERVLVQGTSAVRKYGAQCKKLGCDIIEISAGPAKAGHSFVLRHSSFLICE